MLHGKTLQFEDGDPEDVIVEKLKALASIPRWRILQYLASGGHTVNEIANALDLPASTATAHIKVLEEAGLLHTELQAATHGLQKVCTRTYDNVLVHMPGSPRIENASVEITMPIGAYSRFSVQPTCGLASESAIIGYLDDSVSFYEPERIQAALIWFRSGFLEYSFPNRLPTSATLNSLQMSMEICSEAPLHNNNWPSDITLWINDQAVGVWTCPGDFGGFRGQLTPLWWDINDTQYGLLKRWLINDQGTFIDGRRLSNLSIADLALDQQRVITVRIGVQPDALHVGGMNLFGRTFGNYPQDLTLRLDYLPGQATRPASATTT
ncbi:MAG: helix-turn-helix domain-containing protein [Herpetosiphonaceae bacterium]|nr:helix-turn-helix domain-containing protein [Herpetosiphonaceae bacterium]